MEQIKMGRTYKHKGNNNIYTAERSVKIKMNGKWLDGVLYREWGTTGIHYVREVENFKDRFELAH